MDLWIRSQDKMQLRKVEHVKIAHKEICTKSILDPARTVKIEECCIFVNGSNFGEYKTEQRAIEVLDKIQKYLYSSCSTINEFGFSDDRNLSLGIVVYQMPVDEGVEND